MSGGIIFSLDARRQKDTFKMGKSCCSIDCTAGEAAINTMGKESSPVIMFVGLKRSHRLGRG